MSKNRRRNFFANKIHRDIFFIVSLAAILPALIVGLCLFFLIFSITANEFGIPEAIAYNIIPAAQKVAFILLFAAPISILIILVFTYKMTHTIVGPFERLVNELDQCLEGKKQGHLTLRKKDKFWPLVSRINKLLDKTK